MEGCLMEDKMAWRRVHTELVENHRLVQDMNAMLAKSRACRSELLCCVTADGTEDKGKGDTGKFCLVLVSGFLHSVGF